jgi:hypothetical protein
MADLRKLQDTMGLRADSAMRSMVLRRHKVSAESLEAAARVLADDPDRASNVWHEIDRKALDRRPNP